MHRIIAPTPAMAAALAEFVNLEGGIATWLTSDYGPLVLAEAPSRVINAACRALSFGEVRRG